jgi:hypothetical protein
MLLRVIIAFFLAIATAFAQAPSRPPVPLNIPAPPAPPPVPTGVAPAPVAVAQPKRAIQRDVPLPEGLPRAVLDEARKARQ